MFQRRLGIFLALLFAMCGMPVYAQTVDHASSEHEPASSHESEHGSHKNVFSLFAGVTHVGRRENGAALGLFET